MTVTIPAPPESDFSRTPNAMLRDQGLTYAEKGMLAYIASHEATYALTMEQIIEQGSDGADAVRSILRGLERKHYLKRTPVRGYRGRVVRYDYAITDPHVTAYGVTASGLTASGPTASGQAATSDDQGKHGVSAGGTASGLTASCQPEAKKTTTPTEKKTTEKTRAARGTRLPEDWRPSDDLLAWFLDELVDGKRWSAPSREALRREHAIFADYWWSAAGPKANKVDWSRAWKVWMRKSFPQPIGAPPAAPRVQSFADQERERQEAGDRRAQAIDALMEAQPGLTVGEAAKLVDDEIAKRMAPRTVGTYIEMESVPANDDAREVTA